MAVNGWSDNSLRTWTGTEGTTISADTGTFTDPGMLTRDTNDGIEDFTFIMDIDVGTDLYGTGGFGGIIFCVNSSTPDSNNYIINWGVNIWDAKYGKAATLFYFGKDSPDGTAAAATTIMNGYYDSTSTTFTIKVVKSGNDISIYYDGTLIDKLVGTANFTVNDTTYDTGNIGLSFSELYTASNTVFTFVSLTDDGTTARRRIMIIS